jgi:hypothetical protein
MKGPPGEIVLVPDLCLDDFPGQTDENRYQYTPIEGMKPDKSRRDCCSYRVPLGEPIIEVFLKEQEAQGSRDMLRECLRRWVELDYTNVTYRHLDVPFTAEWMRWDTNVPPEQPARIYHYWNGTFNKNIPEVLSSLAPGITSLILNLNAQGQLEKVEQILPIARLARQYGVLDPMGVNALERFDPA